MSPYSWIFFLIVRRRVPSQSFFVFCHSRLQTKLRSPDSILLKCRIWEMLCRCLLAAGCTSLVRVLNVECTCTDDGKLCTLRYITFLPYFILFVTSSEKSTNRLTDRFLLLLSSPSSDKYGIIIIM